MPTYIVRRTSSTAYIISLMQLRPSLFWIKDELRAVSNIASYTINSTRIIGGIDLQRGELLHLVHDVSVSV